MDWMKRLRVDFLGGGGGEIFSWNAIFFIKFVFHFFHLLVSVSALPPWGDYYRYYFSFEQLRWRRQSCWKTTKRKEKHRLCLYSLLIHISLTCCDNYSLFTINFSSTYNAFSVINWLSIVDESCWIHLYVLVNVDIRLRQKEENKRESIIRKTVLYLSADGNQLSGYK